jgi:hypothetical protein
VNRSVDEAVTSADRPAPVVEYQPRPLWLVMTVVAAHPLLLAIAFRSQSLLVSIPALSAAYVIGIYVTVCMARSVGERRIRPVAAAAALAAVIGGGICPTGHMYTMMMTWATITASGVVVGYRACRETGRLRLYLWGLGTVIVGALAVNVPQWTAMVQAAGQATVQMLSDLQTSLTAAGYGAQESQDFLERAKKALDMTTRVLPAATIMNVVAQFSIGFLWFLGRRVPSTVVSGRLLPFVCWKLPFSLTPVVVLAILARLLGNDTLKLVSDNVLLSLSIFYCVAGLSLIEWGLGRLKMTTGIKVLFYIMLTLTGLIGYFVAVVLGFVDSFADWRKVSAPVQST